MPLCLNGSPALKTYFRLVERYCCHSIGAIFYILEHIVANSETGIDPFRCIFQPLTERRENRKTNTMSTLASCGPQLTTRHSHADSLDVTH